MSRRTPLPGAEELFRRTAEPASAEPADGAPPAAAPSPALAAVPAAPDGDPAAPAADEVLPAVAVGATPVRAVRSSTRRRRPAERRPSGREKHDEKITVYVSPDELLELEEGKIALRRHGLVVDRGRIVREAMAVVLADLEAKGDESILVRRLRGA